MQRSFRPIRTSHGGRPGFSLVEMLVATALVVLIMLLFAQIYGAAIKSITTQRSLSRNDQKARVFTTVLREDLQNMTFRQPSAPYGDVRGLVVLAPGDEALVDPVNQRGYLYISENEFPGSSPNDREQVDDLIQFTAMVRVGSRGDAATRNERGPYSGRAANETGTTNNADLDDGLADGRGVSRAAEICYFVRRGNLYRRVLLLRDPPAAPLPLDPQPTNAAGVRKYSASGIQDYNGPGSFYHDYDYSATRRGNGAANFLWFHSVDSLDNTRGLSNHPIAIPQLRFGFNLAATNPALASVEFINGGADYIGRFTAEETSSTAFTFPGTGVGPSNPYEQAATLTLDATTGAVSGFQNGDRAGEDLLLPNVDAFDIDIVDESLTTTPPGPTVILSMGEGQDFNSAFSPDQKFDTWHPAAGNTIPWRGLRVPGGFVTWTANSPASLGVQLQPNNQSASIIYECIRAGNTGEVRPEFPLVPGTVVQDGQASWMAIDNRIPLKGIQFTIRYRDIDSNQPRYVTLFHSFVE